MMDNEHNDRNTPIKLEPLTPQYLEEEHQVYVSALEEALLDDRVKNIALSGIYGVGKSSILRQLTDNLGDRVIEISLSTLAPVGLKLEESSLPSQAATPTNRIQKEIVKQLLYREQTSRAPASRFRKIEKFSCTYAIGVGVLIGFVLTLGFMLAGWDQQLAERFVKENADLRIVDCAIFITLIALIVLFQRLIHGKVRIKHLSAGAAAITLDDASVSYFDQYLDEIVYFFQVEKYDVVIFEDIDRFDDAHIFETLKSLNTIINHVPKIEKPIRFIYAIKDSIFDQESISKQSLNHKNSDEGSVDPARVEIERANRTKFFDVIIPVVPFVTQATARNIAFQIMDVREFNVDVKLVDLAGRYVPDMRLLKNVRNEFMIFRKQIIASCGEELGLDESRLFAMVLYKNTHLSDFEKIRLGASRFDLLYRFSRNLVEHNIAELESEKREARECVAVQDSIAERAKQLGVKLLSFLKRVATIAQYGYEGYSEHCEFKGRIVDDVYGVAFWQVVASANDDDVLTWYRGNSPTLKLTRREIVEELGDEFDFEKWKVEAETSLNDRLQQIDDDINFLRGAGFADLIERSDFTVQESDSDESSSFRCTVEKLFGSGLAFELIRLGYLDMNYALYSSTYRSNRVSVRAMNYIIHHINNNQMDVYYLLDSSEVESILSQYGSDRIRETVFYNISILDWLFNHDSLGADRLIATLDETGPKQVAFVNAYFTRGAQPELLLRRLMYLCDSALMHVIETIEVDEQIRAHYVDIVLLDERSAEQVISLDVSSYLVNNYQNLAVCTEVLTQVQAERVADFFARANVKFSDLSPIGFALSAILIEKDMYELTRNNLTIVAGGSETGVGLDLIRKRSSRAYRYVVSNVRDYLNILESSDSSVGNPNEFVSILNELSECDDVYLDGIIQAAHGCEVGDLQDVSESLWPFLALYKKFVPSFDNVHLYLQVYGADDDLGYLLAVAGGLVHCEAVPEEEKQVLAQKVLAYADECISACLRVELVKSLGLTSFVDVDFVKPERGRLFSLLLQESLIEDNERSYRRLISVDWTTRSEFISVSREFVNYMTPDLVGADLWNLLNCASVPDDVKRCIVINSDRYCESASTDALCELARLAVDFDLSVSISLVATMANVGVDSGHVLQLLTPHLDYLSREDLFSVLRDLGDPYALLVHPRRPDFVISYSDATVLLLDRLIDFGVVNSYERRGDSVEVNFGTN